MENYEKKYKEVLEKAKALYKASEPMSGCNVILETLFPELAESEDEKVKNSLINLIKMSNEVGGLALHKWEADEMLAWIEKQDEKKPADKDEPKFKIGDWIINPKTGNVLQIKNVLLCGNKGNYEFDYSSMPIESVDKHYHLWTIQDAKHGDVLIVGDEDDTGIAICGKNDKLGNNILYCYYDDENGFTMNTPIASECLLHPATKEQRELLFKKMKEAGYEWDAEKKELKKFHIIDEGKSEMDYCFTKMMCGEKVSSAWSEEDEELLKWSINNLTELKDRYGEGYGNVGKCIDWLRALKERIGGNV